MKLARGTLAFRSAQLGLVALALAACAQDVPTGRRCAPTSGKCVADTDRDDGGFGNSNADGAAAGSGAVGNNLSVDIRDIGDMQIEIVTIACARDCAEVVAVAYGGNAPYTFAWDDGSTNARRQVCPDSSTEFSVQATDTAFKDDEFNYQAQTATARVTAHVLDCPAADGGSTTDACLANPSFEGKVTATQFEAFSAAPWNACYAGGLSYAAIGDATLWPLQNWSFPSASDGATYLALGQQAAFQGRASQTLCEPISAGSTRSFLVDLARAPSSDPNSEAKDQTVQILGGNSECSESTLLWTSPALSLEWTTHCVTLAPQADVATIAFRAAGSGGLMEALVDNIVPVDSCATSP